MATAPKPKINITKDYRLFMREDHNRALNVSKHRKLMESMKEYGFLSEFPIVVIRNGHGKLIIKDGQHRLAFAETLGLPVYWVEASQDWDVAQVNSTPEKWKVRDYADSWAQQGRKSYLEAIEFHERHGIPITTSIALLAGTTTWTNIQDEFISGDFQIKDREWAEAVVGIYGPFAEAAKHLRNARFVEACMAVCRVEGFTPSRLLMGMRRCNEKLVAYSTRDGYLDMLESIYNFGRKQLFPLKMASIQIMRDRNAVNVKKKAKAAKAAT